MPITSIFSFHRNSRLNAAPIQNHSTLAAPVWLLWFFSALHLWAMVWALWALWAPLLLAVSSPLSHPPLSCLTPALWPWAAETTPLSGCPDPGLIVQLVQGWVLSGLGDATSREN